MEVFSSYFCFMLQKLTHHVQTDVILVPWGRSWQPSSQSFAVILSFSLMLNGICSGNRISIWNEVKQDLVLLICICLSTYLRILSMKCYWNFMPINCLQFIEHFTCVLEASEVNSVSLSLSVWVLNNLLTLWRLTFM